MAGLYIHIPFCKSRCVYCGFYSTTRFDLRQRYVDAVCKEMEERGEWREERGEKREESGERIETVYLGGGTPSQLSGEQLSQLFSQIDKVYSLRAGTETEVTMECNPDDVTAEFAALLSQLPVNRVSMGAQTFSDERLRFLHRRHTTQQVKEAVARLREAGIGNISIDLMYGFPDETLDSWQRDIDEALALGVEHLSAYSLMYEEGTPLYRLLEQGKIEELDEELSLQMYDSLIDRLTEAGYEHYEISNFALPGFRSRHNSNYWHAVPYIGLGAAAHSYDGQRTRRWNVSDIAAYLSGIEHQLPYFETETLDDDTLYNEKIMTALRTCEGLPLVNLSAAERRYCLSEAKPFLDDGLLLLAEQKLRLSRRGLFVSNMIMSSLMKV